MWLAWPVFVVLWHLNVNLRERDLFLIFNRLWAHLNAGEGSIKTVRSTLVKPPGGEGCQRRVSASAPGIGNSGVADSAQPARRRRRRESQLRCLASVACTKVLQRICYQGPAGVRARVAV